MSNQQPLQQSALLRNGGEDGESGNEASSAQEDRTIAEILSVLRNLRITIPTTQTELHSRLSTARNIIAFLNGSSWLARPDRYDDQIFIIAELQNISYHDTDFGGAQDIAQWCVRSYLELLAQNRADEAPEVLTGLGHAWLLRAQRILARIHRQEGSSSSGASSGQRSAGRAYSITSSEDAREAARQNIEADARAGGPDYVEARGMLLPATEHFQRAVAAAERAGRSSGDCLASVSLLA
ncbi:uncharacterized protein HMPREF1541_02662 [Cyphellophora europaea CBS 101466]|uniref:Uncharacterized protein n=1 Tax=Cyphellophora europaea (strain CBS 101466) TaxID=1220924 RepID=W2S645_CYPE1|nr:uncharacterized protein HMPREF1541_02662 [Cyphellophora europaea CBS 101466]ETN43503.1 hypothetical protein HMPREF1541_02662 [Cyphellophora europaea CBS 101466]